MRVRSHKFKELSRQALQDQRLQENLCVIGIRFSALRELAFSKLGNADELRTMARSVKENSLSNLPWILETLESNIQKAGGHLHWARNAKEANEIVLSLARKYDARTIVKGKSMVSEEIGLNRFLAKHGLQVWETDLGEFIIQLAHEPPSHIVGPALHKNRKQIAQLFAKNLGISYTEDPQELAMAARRFLRERFLTADMGISGANIVVAETGSIVLLENEGNIRLTTTIPRVHVAITGIEKVISTLEDLGILLSILARSATGQDMAVYTSIITGPRKEEELDGPEEFHLILLDNGRSKIYAHPVLRESLYCLRCGACLNSCPVYLKAGGHSYGWVYSGPMGLMFTSQLLPPRLARQLPHASTLCGACRDVCPVKIDIPKVLLELRARFMEGIEKDTGTTFLDRFLPQVYAWVISHPAVYSLLSRAARKLRPVLCPGGRWLPLLPPFSRWTRKRSFPALPSSFSQMWPDLKKKLMQSRRNP